MCVRKDISVYVCSIQPLFPKRHHEICSHHVNTLEHTVHEYAL